jgi:hypothetical protein
MKAGSMDCWKRRSLLLLPFFPILFLPAADCRPALPVHTLFEVDTRQYAVPFTPSGRASGERKEDLILGARAAVRLLPQSLRVETVETRLEAPEGEEPERKTSAVRVFYDFENASIWVSVDGAAPERRRLEEIAYEEANRLRRQKMAFAEAFVRLPWVRTLPDVDLFWGDLRVRDMGRPAGAQEPDARLKKIAAEAGEVWEAIVIDAPSLLDPPAMRERYILGALGLSVERSRAILDRLGGMPIKIIQTRYVQDADVVLWSERLFSGLREEEGTPEETDGEAPGAPSAIEREQARRLEEKLADPERLLDLIRGISAGEKEEPRLATHLGLFLRLSARMDRDLLEKVLDLANAVDDAFSQVELARVALRFDATHAGPPLRAVVQGESGARAMNVAEALVAEGQRTAVPAIAQILWNRQQYADVDPDAVAAWGVQHLRVLSGAPLESVAKVVPQAAGDGSHDPGADLAVELDFWLSWWEREKGRYPPP